MPEFQLEVTGTVASGVGAATLTIVNPPPPVEYDAAGFMACEITAESTMALALRSRVRRMTHTDQQTKRPGDNGFVNADTIGQRQWLFFTREFLRRHA